MDTSYRTPPSKTKVLIVGGGPSGSYAASVLARRNIDVVLLEAAAFPRYHVGETFLASVNYFLEYIGVRDRIWKLGFVRKPGGAFKLRSDYPVAYTNFVDHNTGNAALSVMRDEFDNCLFRHAGAQGVNIFDRYKVTSLTFSDADSSRPVAAAWQSLDGQTGSIAFQYLIDATGRQGLLSTKYHKDRKITDSMKNIAVWAYWREAESYGKGTEREGSPLIEAMNDHSGWCWYIPVAPGLLSVGFVMHESFFKQKRAGMPLNGFYLSLFENVPLVSELKAPGYVVSDLDGRGTSVFMASDYSYMSADLGAKNYRLVGDAAYFIDPFFSSGVHLAFVSALSAAVSLLSVIDGTATEDEAAKFHSNELMTAYTRFFLVVAAGYKQMQGKDGENIDFLNDVDETSFDRAFDLIRPVIQGTGDIGVDKESTGTSGLSQAELTAAMDFVLQIFTTAEPGNSFPTALDADTKQRLLELRESMPFWHRQEAQAVLDEAKRKLRSVETTTAELEL